VRCFLGVELSDPVREQVARRVRRLTRELGSHADRVNWVPSANLHITLHFFGNLDDTRVGAVKLALLGESAVTPFPVTIAGAGCFPRPSTPRVIWFGVAQGAAELRAVHRTVQERLAPLAMADPPGTRPYAPHLTVGRVREPSGGRRRTGRTADWQRTFGTALASAMAAVKSDCGGFDVDHFTLFESRLSPKGATYHAAARFPLCT
jgi:RNA 2',3'-cyclic 3'-phosphodiesterase